jgi:methyl-accepting chemotaxis protein
MAQGVLCRIQVLSDLPHDNNGLVEVNVELVSEYNSALGTIAQGLQTKTERITGIATSAQEQQQVSETANVNTTRIRDLESTILTELHHVNNASEEFKVGFESIEKLLSGYRV